MDGRRSPRDNGIPPLLVFIVVLTSGAAALQFARMFFHMSARVGNGLFVALPIFAILCASRYADRT